MQKKFPQTTLKFRNWIQPDLQTQRLYPDKTHYIAEEPYVTYVSHVGC